MPQHARVTHLTLRDRERERTKSHFKTIKHMTCCSRGWARGWHSRWWRLARQTGRRVTQRSSGRRSDTHTHTHTDQISTSTGERFLTHGDFIYKTFDRWPLLTSSNTGLFPLRMQVLLVCPATVTLTTGWILMPGNCLPSMIRTRTWRRRSLSFGCTGRLVLNDLLIQIIISHTHIYKHTYNYTHI